MRASGLLLTTFVAVAGCVETELRPPPEVAVLVQDLAAYWDRTLPGEVGDAPEVVLADGDLDTGCGPASVEEGSFFCAEDSTIYLQQIDLDEPADRPARLRDAASVYLLAHEYAHAVQEDLEVDQGDALPGPDGDSVRYELQADCLAGAYVASRGDEVDLAAQLEVVREGGDDVGEDRLPPARYEHGTAAQRVQAFQRGARSGHTACDLPTT